MSEPIATTLSIPQTVCQAGGAIRTAGTTDAPLFCLADLCRALDLSNPSAVAKRLDDDETITLSLMEWYFGRKPSEGYIDPTED